MNLVAHLVLSFHNEELMVGNWLGEVVKGKNYELYSEDIKNGILLHREIDSFTDSHPIIKKSTEIFHSTQHKYSPIVVDLIMDYFLIKNWNKFYPSTDYQTFKQIHYSILEKRMFEFTDKLQHFTQQLIKYDWFENYATIEGIKEVLTQMSRRSKYLNNMDAASKEIYFYEHELNILFLEYFPLLEDHCKKFLNAKGYHL